MFDLLPDQSSTKKSPSHKHLYIGLGLLGVFGIFLFLVISYIMKCGELPVIRDYFSNNATALPLPPSTTTRRVNWLSKNSWLVLVIILIMVAIGLIWFFKVKSVHGISIDSCTVPNQWRYLLQAIAHLVECRCHDSHFRSAFCHKDCRPF